jgi:Ca-activated chloride channel family protein
MNVAVVLDLRADLTADAVGRVRALLSAMNRARQPGDRFSLTLAGRPGGTLVTAERFREGPLRLALGRLFAPRAMPEGPAFGLVQAVRVAMEDVRLGADASAPLGASLVLLVTGAELGPQLTELETLAHTGAVSGISLSTIQIAEGARLEELERLVLAGQGNRRILRDVADAERIVDRELFAASRAVARAVRLRIRLAPGVKLVDLLGSRRLAEPDAQRVREVEQSIDLRLARRLGIQADRGEDEEGLQIVIPAFYAGDSHVLLVDVVAPRPGPLLEVSVRYKDLVHLRNGITRARLTIPAGARERGPLERNVLKNLLALRLAETARRASADLRGGDPVQARAALRRHRDLLAGLIRSVPEWSGDAELGGDLRLLGSYLAALEGPGVGPAARQHGLADSLRYAAFRRLVPLRE